MARISYGFAAPIAETTVPAAVADGADVNIWINEYGQQVIAGYNPASNSLDVSDVAPALTQVMAGTWAQLTAAGSTAWIDVSVYNTVAVQITIAAAAAGDTVTVGVYGSHDLTGIYLIGTTATYAANGCYLLDYSGRKFPYVRLTFVSETGTAALTVDGKYFAGNI